MALKDFTDPNSPTGSGAGAAGAPNPLPFIMSAPQTDAPDIQELKELINYNERSKDMDPVLFRDGIIEELTGALIGYRKPNALLIGPAGAGKTAIVEELARRIANADPTIPDTLKDATIYELSLQSLVSHGGIVGKLEERIQLVIDYVTNPENNIVLFIDEIHRLTKDTEGGNNPYRVVSQTLKPMLARRDLRVIGATTTQEAKSFMRDPAFSRRFTRVLVDELTCEQTAVVLEKLWPSMSKHYDDVITLNTANFKSIVEIADELSPASQHRPDNAITLLDRSCADAVIRKQHAIAAATDDVSRQQMATLPVVLRPENVRQVAMRNATGHATPDSFNVDAFDSNIARILGQDRPVSLVRRALRRRDLGIFNDKRPLSMLFAGPSGVGKSEVARIISDVLFHEEPITLNMTEYSSPADLNKIVGTPQGFSGSTWDNELPFDTLETNPYRLILLDEFEKADRSVQRLFMSALEDGYIKTALGKEIDFGHAIIVATTNANHSAGATSSVCGFMASDDIDDASSINELTGWFDAELLNRFSFVTTFNKIDRAVYADIVAADWKREVERIKALKPKLELDDELDEESLARLVRSTYNPLFGARPAHKAVTEEIERILLEE